MSKLRISYEPMTIATIIRICRGGARIHKKGCEDKDYYEQKKVVA